MKIKILFINILLLSACAASKESNLLKTKSSETSFTIISNPIHFNKEPGVDFMGSENLIFVPENRSSLSGRKIAVHYFKLDAKEKSDLAPVFYLPGGPGGYFDERHFYQQHFGLNSLAWTTELNVYNKYRDIIIINQRGNSNAPGFSIRDFKYNMNVGSRGEAMDFESSAIRKKEAILSAVEDFKKKEIDPAGYDILNIIDDIEAIRQYHGYEKIALVGSSFGSQWALGYLQKYGNRVEKALLAGIEPLDCAVDDPADVWQMFTRLANYAESDTRINQDLPDIGLMEAVKIIITRLAHKPILVELNIPGENKEQSVIIGVDDFRANLEFPFITNRQEALSAWPKYISELYRGDYRTLAYWALQKRNGVLSDLLIIPLIDNSLGISEERKSLISSREEIQWTGDYTRSFSMLQLENLTPDAGDNFRKQKVQEIPILMIQGDLDRNTPLENAQYLLPYFKNGFLAKIERGTHSAKKEVIFQHPQLANQLFEFINIDFRKTNFSDFTNSLPDTYELRSIDFLPIFGESLFEIVIDK